MSLSLALALAFQVPVSLPLAGRDAPTARVSRVAKDLGSMQPFVEGNLLLTTNDRLFEYTPAGVQVQDITVPNTLGSNVDVSGVAVDSDGRAHVLITRAFGDDEIATLDPSLGTWTSHPVVAFLGNVSDGDLSIQGRTLYTKSRAISLDDFSTRPIAPPSFGGVGEIAVGLPGRLHALDSGSPRWRVRTIEASDFSLITTRELRDANGFRLDMRGLAIAPNGDLYAADWDGRIYWYDQDANLLLSQLTADFNLLCIDISRQGQVVTGSRSGTVSVLSSDLSMETSFTVSSGLVYVSFVPPKSQLVDFEPVAGSAALPNGRALDGGSLVSDFVAMTGQTTAGLGAAIFDSSPTGPNARSTDPDLLVDRGNVMVLQERPDQTVPGIYDHPDDDAFGGQLILDFGGVAVTPLSIDLIDICPSPFDDGVDVTLFDAYGRSRTFLVPSGWTEDISFQGGAGYRTLNLDSLDPQAGFMATATAAEDAGFSLDSVLRMEIEVRGSAAVDQLRFLP